MIFGGHAIDPYIELHCSRSTRRDSVHKIGFLKAWRDSEVQVSCRSFFNIYSTILKICFLRKLDLDDDWYHIKWRFKSPGIVQRFSGCRNERSLLVNPQCFFVKLCPTHIHSRCLFLTQRLQQKTTQLLEAGIIHSHYLPWEAYESPASNKQVH